ncbi:hypothetical protein QR680_008087 [Steinernema hermaphroditum]|uniref:Uncharacterized protein n=1 Tax=Steinernema hermaphroditum TaxID=289476 RepID=A0AA39M7H1_9BILA|nr:hypothetical protein QR680_008087 [Steinernema hermaphroditum]
MDQVPVVFSNAVAATVGRCGENPLFQSRQWRRAFHDHHSRIVEFIFNLTDCDGTWKYAFQAAGMPGIRVDTYFTLAQMREHVDLHHVRITTISISRLSETLYNPPAVFYTLLDLDMDELLKFVLSLSNDRLTSLKIRGLFDFAQDGHIVEGLKGFYFSNITIWNYRDIFDDLLKSHFQRNRWTVLHIRSDQWPQTMLEELKNHVTSDDFYNLSIENNTSLPFPFEVFESIFEKFLEDRWALGYPNILTAIFEDTAQEKLKSYRLDLIKSAGGEYFKWKKEGGQELMVQIVRAQGAWTVTCMVD